MAFKAWKLPVLIGLFAMFIINYSPRSFSYRTAELMNIFVGIMLFVGFVIDSKKQNAELIVKSKIIFCGFLSVILIIIAICIMQLSNRNSRLFLSVFFTEQSLYISIFIIISIFAIYCRDLTTKLVGLFTLLLTIIISSELIYFYYHTDFLYSIVKYLESKNSWLIYSILYILIGYIFYHSDSMEYKQDLKQDSGYKFLSGLINITLITLILLPVFFIGKSQ